MEKTTVYSKTARGLAELKASSRNLSRDQIRALIMINGQTSIDEFIRSMPAAGAGHFMAIVRELEQMGLARATPAVSRGEDGPRAPGGLPVIAVEELSGEASVQAWAEARRGARTLQEKGFFAHHDKTDATRPDDSAGGQPGRHALVVEDDEAIVQLLAMLLGEAGFTVTTASSIATAMAQLDGGVECDLVLLDVILPGLPGQDGFHILESIRSNARLRHLPVIMVTSQISDAHVLRGLKAGADGYIFKPFKWETLYACIRSVIG